MSLASRLSSVLRSAARSPAVRRTVRDLGRAAVRAARERGGTSRRPGGADPAPSAGSSSGAGGAGVLADRPDAAGLALDFAPRDDHRADPGEVAWAWVHYEEDLAQGKDRPVLVIDREDAARGGSDGAGEVLVALMLTSRDRAPSGGTRTDEHGSTWVDIGSGSWDRQGRPSEVRADRLLRLAPDGVRREGGRVDERTFARVAEAVRAVAG